MIELTLSAVGTVLRMALAGVGVALGSVSWVLLAYATATLLVSDLSRWGGVMYGAFFVLEIVAVAWALVLRRDLPRAQFATAFGAVGWICAVFNLLLINVFHATL